MDEGKTLVQLFSFLFFFFALTDPEKVQMSVLQRNWPRPHPLDKGPGVHLAKVPDFSCSSSNAIHVLCLGGLYMGDLGKGLQAGS